MLVLALLLSFAAEADRVYGAPLVPGARKEEEGRYQAMRSYDDALEFYERLFKGNAKIRWKKIIHQPQVKAVHMMNLQPVAGGWSGINLYEVNGQTHLYVLKLEEKPATKKR